MSTNHDLVIHKAGTESRGFTSSNHTGRTHKSFLQSTTDATATTVYSIPIAELEGAFVEVEAVCLQDDATEIGRSQVTSAFRRAASGNVTEAGSPTAVNVDDSAGSPAATLVANTSTQKVDVKVTGVASTNYTWVIDVFYKKVNF